MPCSSAAKVRKARTADISRAADEAPSPSAAPVGEEGAQVRGVEIEQGEPADLLAAMAAEKFDQAMGGGDIGPDGVRAAAAVMGEMAAPARRKRPRRMLLPPLAVDQPPAEHSAKAAPKESQQLRAMPIVEAGRVLLTEQQQCRRAAAPRR